MFLALVTNAALVYVGTHISPVVTCLLIVYEGWLGLLTYLNWYMWRCNGGETTPRSAWSGQERKDRQVGNKLD